MNFGLYNLYKSTKLTNFLNMLLFFVLFYLQYLKLSELKLNTILGLVVAVIVVLFLIDKQNVQDQQNDDELQEKNKISNQKFEYLNTDSELIEILNKMELISNFNKLIYEDCLVHMDNVIKIYNLILDGTERYKYFYDLANKKSISH